MFWGGVKDVSSLTHQAEVCSLAHYKTPVKGGRGRAQGQVLRGARAGGGAGDGGWKGASGQIKTRRKTKTLQEGDECGLQGEGRVRVVSKRDFGLGGWRVLPCKCQPSPFPCPCPSLHPPTSCSLSGSRPVYMAFSFVHIIHKRTNRQLNLLNKTKRKITKQNNKKSRKVKTLSNKTLFTFYTFFFLVFQRDNSLLLPPRLLSTFLLRVKNFFFL